MKNKALLRKLAILLCLLMALAGCRFATNPGQTGAVTPAQSAAQPSSSIALQAGEEQQGALQRLLEDRMAAVNSGDQRLYLSTVLPSDPVLQQEEANLIRAASGLGIDDYRLAAAGVRQREDGFTATLEQSYTLGGRAHACAFDAVFKTENGKLYYGGPDFERKESPHVRVYHTGADETLAGRLLDAETETLRQMERLLDFVPDGFITIKLFADQQVFLQSVKLDLPEWVGGWHEYGESIKSFTGAYGSDAANYKSMLNHESTHRMVSELSNDNAAYWLQEGLAGVFEDWLDDPDGPYLSSGEAAMDYTPYSRQKTIDLEKIGIDDSGAVMLYYASSKAYAAFLLDRYGWDKMREALQSMKKHELIPVTAAEKIHETNERTDEAVRTVFGLDDQELQTQFDRWLAGLSD